MVFNVCQSVMAFSDCHYKTASQLIVQQTFTQWADNSKLDNKQYLLHLVVNKCICCPPTKQCQKWHHFGKCECEPSSCPSFYQALKLVVCELLKINIVKNETTVFCGKQIVKVALKFLKCSKLIINELLAHTCFRVKFNSNLVFYQIGPDTKDWQELVIQTFPWIKVIYPKKARPKKEDDPKILATLETLRKMEQLLDPRRSMTRR